MAFSDIWKYKKQEQEKIEKTFIKNLVVGSDVFAIDLYDHLNLKEANSTKLLSKESLTDGSLNLLGPSLIRGNQNIEILRNRGIEGQTSHSIFYKDMKFHKFGSRAKPVTLLWGEEQFIDDHIGIDLKRLLPSISKSSILDDINKNTFVMNIQSVKRATPEELIDQANWAIKCTNGLVIECQNLYWGETPADLYEYVEDKKSCSLNFVEFCQSTKTPCALYVHMRLKEKITDKKETFFFPMSFTHEWGHFIGEIEDNNDEQIGKFITFINKDESSEEDISKKIRLLKKNLEKNFEKFSDSFSSEYVVLKENAYCPKIDDNLLINQNDNQDFLTFFSFNAPFDSRARELSNFEDSWLSTTLLTRALLVQDTIKSL